MPKLEDILRSYDKQHDKLVEKSREACIEFIIESINKYDEDEFYQLFDHFNEGEIVSCKMDYDLECLSVH